MRLMEVTGVSSQKGKVVAVRAKIGVGRGFIPYGEGMGGTCQKEAGVEKRRLMMT